MTKRFFFQILIVIFSHRATLSTETEESNHGNFCAMQNSLSFYAGEVVTYADCTLRHRSMREASRYELTYNN